MVDLLRKSMVQQIVADIIWTWNAPLPPSLSFPITTESKERERIKRFQSIVDSYRYAEQPWKGRDIYVFFCVSVFGRTIDKQWNLFSSCNPSIPKWKTQKTKQLTTLFAY